MLEHLTDAQIKELVLPGLWAEARWVDWEGNAHVGLPYAPDWGVADAWVSEFRQGRYRGLPVTEERTLGTIAGKDRDGNPISGEVKVQRFEFGMVTYRDSDATFSWG